MWINKFEFTFLERIFLLVEFQSKFSLAYHLGDTHTHTRNSYLTSVGKWNDFFFLVHTNYPKFVVLYPTDRYIHIVNESQSVNEYLLIKLLYNIDLFKDWYSFTHWRSFTNNSQFRWAIGALSVRIFFLIICTQFMNFY